eukprot:TRINITY_DN6076_c0_g1_i1.p1 TRINITY_DN6076_c0_g1~~TRINITY_DN6076_c0_g1_i1.p1  ORF type:complete len:146 (+),score=47.15 TRINITY_DN6076_c0_g1_i1:295-732(+)
MMVFLNYALGVRQVKLYKWFGFFKHWYGIGFFYFYFGAAWCAGWSAAASGLSSVNLLVAALCFAIAIFKSDAVVPIGGLIEICPPKQKKNKEVNNSKKSPTNKKKKSKSPTAGGAAADAEPSPQPNGESPVVVAEAGPQDPTVQI